MIHKDITWKNYITESGDALVLPYRCTQNVSPPVGLAIGINASALVPAAATIHQVIGSSITGA